MNKYKQIQFVYTFSHHTHTCIHTLQSSTLLICTSGVCNINVLTFNETERSSNLSWPCVVKLIKCSLNSFLKIFSLKSFFPFFCIVSVLSKCLRILWMNCRLSVMIFELWNDCGECEQQQKIHTNTRRPPISIKVNKWMNEWHKSTNRKWFMVANCRDAKHNLHMK